MRTTEQEKKDAKREFMNEWQQTIKHATDNKTEIELEKLWQLKRIADALEECPNLM